MSVDEVRVPEIEEDPVFWERYRALDLHQPGQESNGDHNQDPATLLRVVSLASFVSVTEDSAIPLIGEPDDALLDATGMLLMYGDGGAGKTTLSIDALAHLASGTEWLGLSIPNPVHVLLIENEGPRMPFRRKLKAKVAAWKGAPFIDNVHVLEEPWTHFTLSDPDYREALAREIDRTQSDLLMVGPLASIGAKGGGTPDEINEFDSYVSDLRQRCPRPFAPWIVHHENKAGDVSGAWERLPDSLVHVQAQGNGRTRINWRKVRWSSTLHGTSTNLIWGEGASFIAENPRERDLVDELKDKWPRDAWMTAKEAGKMISANADNVRDTLLTLVQAGAFEYQEGPPGRRFNSKCWRRLTDSDRPSQFESVTPIEGFDALTDSLTQPYRESQGVSQFTQNPATDSDPRVSSVPTDAQTAAPDDDGIPF